MINKLKMECFMLIIFFILIQSGVSQTCTRQRCCLINPCTSSYCASKSSQTWIDTSTFYYTKLVLSNNSCKPCPYDCQTCQSESVCSTCAKGFYMDNTTSKCMLCSDRCLSCTVINSITKCSSCQTGTYLDTVTQSCKSCPVGAKSCSSSTAIIDCQTGYRKSSNSLYCTTCPSNCISCPNSDTVCSSCATGYYLNTSSLCSQCVISNCLTCIRSGSTIGCTSCNSGYILSSGTCKSCPNNCKTCTSASVCTICNTGYFISSGTCVSTSNSVTNCQTYSSSTVCSSCSTSYFLSSNVCYPCSLLCSACIGPHFGLCTTCNSNAAYFNEMCLITNFPSTTTYNLYFSFPASIGLITNGALSCASQYITGTSITLNLNNLKAYKLEISWKIYSKSSSTSYTVALSNTAGNTNSTYTTSSTLNYNNICDNDSSTYYYLDIQKSQIFSSIKILNTLTFSNANNVSLALHQVIITAYRCNDLCIECSQTLCTQCLMTKLYTQDAYCVSVCSNNYYVYLNSTSTTNPKQCLSSCPLGSYTLTSNVSCMPCKSPCLTCLNEQFCLSCVDGYYLTKDNYCNATCPYKYYGKTETKTCQKCVGRCLQCINQQQCLSCMIGFLFNTTMSCVDSCQSTAINVNGLYADLGTLYCQNCNSNCQNCLYESTLCTQCISSMYLYDSQCLSSCPLGNYAPVSSNICQTCSYPCKACSIISTNCTSCLQGYLLNSSCVSSCPSGYYEDNVNLLCVQCYSMCQQCYGSSSYCLSCKTGYFYYQYGCYSTCPAENYKNTTTYNCVNCVGLCLDCLNQTYCLSCKSNFLYNGTCVASGQCPSGYFADMVTLSCQPCSSPCKQCQYTSIYCTACDINNPSGLIFLESNTCVSSCSSTYFYQKTNSTSATCEPCQQPCLQCLSQSLCLSCISGYKYSNNLCSSTCSISTYFDTIINDCANCSSNCQICSSSLFCQKCSTNYYISFISSLQNQCVLSCPSTYYAQTVSQSCQKCIYPCDTCSSSIDCITCLSGVAYQSRCISSCPDSTFLSTTNTCISCDANCLTCSNDPIYCQSCNDGYYLYSGNHSCVTACPSGLYPQSMTKQCLACPSSCSTCVNTTYCLTCIQNTTFMAADNSCVAACPSGYYGNTSTLACEKCSSKCLTCQSTSTNCVSCPTGYYFIQISYSLSDCQLSCPDGYYPESNYCYECSFPCKTCSTSSNCITCIEGTYYHAISSSCLLNCPTSTFYNHTNSTCQSCQYPCSSCDNNSTYCLSCSQSNNGTLLYLYNGQCVQICPTYYYSDSSGICNKCFGLCLTCSSKYYCNSCIAGYVYNGFCYSSCPLGTFANTTANICQNCSVPCSQCVINSNYCTKCTSGLFVYKGNCSSSCPSGTYQESSQCKSCTFPCVNCSSQNTCNQCLGGYLLYMNLACITDVALCPNDFYKMDAKYCVPITWCPSEYFIDQTLKTCSASCDHKQYTNLNTKRCQSSCSQGWYAGVNLVCQQWAVNPPILLMGMSAITFIQSSYLYIEIQFNQTVVWNDIESSMYTLSLINTARLLILSQYSVPEYTISLDTPTLLKLKPSTYPQRININLPAYRVMSSATSYPHQNPSIAVNLPSFTPYSSSQIYSGMIMGQFSEGISWFILLLSLFFLFKNRLSDLYVLWDTVQLLYLLIFLDIQYPPNITQFFRGLQFTHFTFLPSIFPDPSSRKISSSPFYAYSYDNSFTRNTGGLFMALIIVFGILALLKISQLAIKKIQSLKQKMREYPQVKGFIYRGVLRYRWHHISDVMFLTYALMMLYAISQIYYIAQNPNYIFSNILSVLTCIAYILWVLFVSYKLYKHFGNISRGKMVNNLKCFYRGIQKENKFGVSLVLVRYARKLFYSIIISIFSTNSMFALPILMFTSVLMALFLFINMPYKKKLSNYITLTSEVVLVIMFILLALINFNNGTFSPSTKHYIGWICCILLALMIFTLIYEVFCKTMFYLQPQINPADIIKDQNKQKLLTDKQKQYLRKKAEEFFDSLLPKLRERLNLDQDSDDEMYKHYEQGDSENSQNNQERQRDWNEEQSHNSDEFKHYDNSEHSQMPTSMNSKQKLKQAPQYLVRCVKDID